MSDRSKKILATGIATLIGLATLAVQMGVVPASASKIMLFLIAALSMINTFFLPAVLGQSVAPPKPGDVAPVVVAEPVAPASTGVAAPIAAEPDAAAAEKAEPVVDKKV